MANSQHAGFAADLFHGGPVVEGNPEFESELEAYLETQNSEPLNEFAAYWLGKREGGRLPTWQSLHIHTCQDLVPNTFMISRPHGSARMFVGFTGNEINENQGVDYTNMAFDEIDDGLVYLRWTGGASYCFNNVAISAVQFDLAFAGRPARKATSVLFPLSPSQTADNLCGYTSWSD